MQQKIRITCKLCKRTGYFEDFEKNCDNEGCQIIMARRNKNTKPPAILTGPATTIFDKPTRHHPDCACARCLDEDATALERAFAEAAASSGKAAQSAKAPVQVPIRVLYREEEVDSYYDEGEERVFIEVPLVICGNIYPKGKKRV